MSRGPWLLAAVWLTGAGAAGAASFRPASGADSTLAGADSVHVPPTAARLDVGGRRGGAAAPADVGRAVDEALGGRTISTGEQTLRPVLRGLGPARVLLVDDGLPVEDLPWIEEEAPSLELDPGATLRLVRGPAGVALGSSALFGVVARTSPELPAWDPARSGLRGTVDAGLASNQSAWSGGVVLEGASRRAGFRLGARGGAGSDLRTPAGRLAGTGFDATSGDVAVGVVGERSALRLRYAGTGGSSEFLREETAHGAVFADSIVRRTLRREQSDHRVQLHVEHFVSGIRLEARAQWQRREASFREPTVPIPADTSALAPADRFDCRATSAGLLLRGLHRWRGLSSLWGASGWERESVSPAGSPAVPDAHAAVGALFADETLELGRLLLRGALRWDLWHHDTDADAALRVKESSRNARWVSGGLGVEVAARRELALFAQAHRSARPPTVYELLAKGPDPSGTRFEIGTVTLDPERLSGLDLGARWSCARLRAAVAAFGAWSDDFIVLVAEGELRDGLPAYAFRPAAAALRGLEVEAEVDLVATVRLTGRLDAVHGEDEDRDAPLGRIPPLRGTVGGVWHAPSWRGFEALVTGAAVEMVAEQERLGLGDRRVPAYALVHLEAGAARAVNAQRVRVDLLVRNVLDTDHRAFLDRYNGFASAPGRDVRLRARVEF